MNLSPPGADLFMQPIGPVEYLRIRNLLIGAHVVVDFLVRLTVLL